MNTSTPFKWHHFQADIILLCVWWYLPDPLSYRDLEEMMRERGLHIDHTTIYRWVQHYAPELEKLGMGFFSSETAWHTLQGYEAMNMLRKGQIRGAEKRDSMKQAICIASLFGVAI
jgi:hypothetical protein